MYRLFAHIRRQPRSVRDQYAFYGAAAFTLLVALFWVVQMASSFGAEVENQMAASAGEQEAVATSRPFSNAFRFFGDVFEGGIPGSSGLEIVLPDLIDDTAGSNPIDVRDGVGGGDREGVGTSSYDWFN